MRIGLTKKISILMISTILIITALLGFVLSYVAIHGSADELRRGLFYAASITAAGIDGDLHRAIELAETEDSDDYRRLYGRLAKIKHECDLAYVYTLVLPGAGDKSVFIVDTGEGENHSPLGMRYDLNQSMREAFAGRSLVESEPYSDQYGTFISAYAPIRNGRGEIVAILAVDKDYGSIRAAMRKLVYIVAGFTVFGIFAGILAALVFSRMITRPVRMLSDSLRQISRGEGDLTVRLNINSHDEICDVAGYFNEFVAKVAAIINDTKRIAAEVAAATDEMTSISDSLAQGASNDAQMIEQIVQKVQLSGETVGRITEHAAAEGDEFSKMRLTITEIVDTIEKLSGDARSTIDKTETITARISSGQRLLDELKEVMRKIHDNAGEMNRIVMMINDISDQINLLSLNASIESARAGEVGRGFAVVADEISKLADGTASSIKEINALIAQSTQAVNDGREVVAGNIELIASILSEVNGISKTVAGMTGVMELQHEKGALIAGESEKMLKLLTNIGVSVDTHRSVNGEIREAIDLIAESSKKTAASTEEYLATAEELSAVADRLSGIIHEFKS